MTLAKTEKKKNNNNNNKNKTKQKKNKKITYNLTRPQSSSRNARGGDGGWLKGKGEEDSRFPPSYTPNANMADLSAGPGLVARKRG